MTLQTRAAAFAGRVGLTGLALIIAGVLILAMLVNTYADFGIKGPLGIGFHYEGWKPKAQRLQGVVDEFGEAQEQAAKAAQEAKERAEQNYRELAERIDDEAEEARAGEMDAAERFIAANRVRCAPDRGSRSGAVAATGDNRAGNGESAGGAAELDAGLVAVPDSDVRICTVNTLQAEAARAWALELEAAN